MALKMGGREEEGGRHILWGGGGGNRWVEGKGEYRGRKISFPAEKQYLQYVTTKEVISGNGGKL